MKKFWTEFFQRGFLAAGFGPIILVIVYLILQKNGVIKTLSVNDVCMEIISVTALAFVAGGINAIHQVERLPLMVSILIHGVVLYACYLAMYLFNGWIAFDIIHVLVFTGIFALGYCVIWVIIYSVTKKRADRLNELMEMKR